MARTYGVLKARSESGWTNRDGRREGCSVKYCRACCQPDTRPNTRFTEDGFCFPCHVAANPQAIDWDARRRELEAIADFGRESNVSGYDCIIGVSGGKDSVRQAMYARDELGLKPLLVCCTYPPEQQTERGTGNLANLIELGFDTVTVSPSPQVSKALMRQSFFKFGNLARSNEMVLYASAPKVAIAYHIPLIFLGENPAITLGEWSGSLGGDASRMKYGNTLGGGDPKDLMAEGMTRKDVLWYTYSSDEEMEQGRLRIVYLGYYIPDFNKWENARFAIEHGLVIRDDPPEDIGDITGAEALDEDFVIVNQMIKYVKYGFGKVTDQVGEFIRAGRMTRTEAIAQVKAYDGRCAQRYLDSFCSYLEISPERFWKVVESYRDPKIWKRGSDGGWELRTALE